MYNIVISLYTVMHNLRQFDPRPRMIPYFSHDALRGGRVNGRAPNIEEPAKELRQTIPTLAGPLAASQPPPTRTEVAPRLMALQKFSRTPFAKRNTMENLGKSWENPQIDQLIFHKYLSVP